MPHRTIDPIVIGSQLVGALQTIASRTTDPVDSVVVSVTKFHGGDAYNVIPERVQLAGTVRTLRKEVAACAEQRMRAICRRHRRRLRRQRSMSTTTPTIRSPSTIPRRRCSPATSRRTVAGEPNVHRAVPPVMGGEDFSYMLEARPGAFIFIGNGDTANLHHPAYDFNDEAIPHGMSYWVQAGGDGAGGLSGAAIFRRSKWLASGARNSYVCAAWSRSSVG